MGLRLSSVAELHRRGEHAVFELTRQVRSPLSTEQTQSTEYVFDAGSWSEGRFRSGPRDGRFRLRPTSLRKRVRAALGDDRGRLLLIPDATAQWENLLPMLARPWRYLPERHLRVESVPPGALLDVSYLRDGARRLFEESRAPVTLTLPPRFVARRADAVEVRAFAAGYEPIRVTLPVHADDERLLVELEPAENELKALWLASLFGETTLRLHTRLPVALQVGRAEGKINLFLPSTALTEPPALMAAGFVGRPVEALSVLQLGPDSLLRLSVAGEPELRFHAAAGLLPDQSWTVVRVGAPETGWRERLEAAAAGVPTRALAGCALAFDDALRSALGESAMRASSLQEETLQALLRRAIRKLADGDTRGAVWLIDGTSYTPTRELELEAALSRASEVRGVFAALRAILAGLGEPADEALRSVAAPALPTARFSEHLRSAERVEEHCIAVETV